MLLLLVAFVLVGVGWGGAVLGGIFFPRRWLVAVCVLFNASCRLEPVGFGWFRSVLVGSGLFLVGFGWFWSWFWLVLVGFGCFSVGFGWFLVGFGWFWLVFVGFCWFWLVLVGLGWLGWF